MTIAQDTTAILATWGQVLTLMRRVPTYSDTGTPTPVWTQQSTPTGDIQPMSGSESRGTAGELILTTHEIYLPNGTDVRGGDRVRPAGWATGDDEYEVVEVLAETPSHVRANAKKVVGHGS